MNKTLTMVMALLLVTAIAGIGFGDTKKADLKAGGKVTAVDASANTLNISVKKTDTVFNVSADTKFKGVKDISAVKVGDTVKITYKVEDGKNIALKIEDTKKK